MIITPIHNLTLSIESALRHENWHAALALSLTMPDICGWIDHPHMKSQARYVEWFNRYLLKTYTREIGAAREPHVFLTGEDCYALRCSLLHHGISDIQRQRAKKALTDFRFNYPVKGHFLHCNKIGSTLQLQVDEFCMDVIRAVLNWYSYVMYLPGTTEKIWEILTIHSTEHGFVA